MIPLTEVIGLLPIHSFSLENLGRSNKIKSTKIKVKISHVFVERFWRGTRIQRFFAFAILARSKSRAKSFHKDMADFYFDFIAFNAAWVSFSFMTTLVRDKVSFILATAFGAGFTPKAPGTAGTVVAIPLTYLVNKYLPLPLVIAVWAIILIAGTWSAYHVNRITQTEDNQKIVIDEVLGYGITMIGCGTAWPTLLAAFILFRLFDIAKFPPVRAVDIGSKRKSKEGQPWFGAFGVMADDLLAGVQGLIVLSLLRFAGVLP
jgi:phosphatidylglycerophosphatase A